MITNAEKYKEVFGFEPEKTMCPTPDCGKCPNRKYGFSCRGELKWWDIPFTESEAENDK